MIDQYFQTRNILKSMYLAELLSHLSFFWPFNTVLNYKRFFTVYHFLENKITLFLLSE
jgi:hypothetical protein